MVPLPQEGKTAQAELDSNAYEVGIAYARPLIDLHQALRRAGYPAHFVDERLLASGVLRNYKVLFVNGQTFALPESVQAALSDFRKSGAVLADRSTAATLPAPVVHELDLSTQTFRGRALLRKRQAEAAKTEHEKSLFETTKLENEPVRQAVPALKALLARTAARPVLATDDLDLVVEKHLAGEGALYMVLNGHEEYPQVAPDAKYPRYNFTPARTSYTLQGIPRGATVYAVEGSDWRQVRELPDPSRPQAASFDTGEMKLYLVAPRKPRGLAASAAGQGNALTVTARLDGVKMPWPLTVTVSGPAGNALYQVHRAMDAVGSYTESFPLGSTAAAGTFAISVESTVGKLKAAARVRLKPIPAKPVPMTEAVRVFDEKTLRDFLRGKPKLAIALGNDGQRALAEHLAADLTKAGLDAAVKPEAEVFRKVSYPRVWSPYATVYSPGGPTKEAPGEVERELSVGTSADGDWRQPKTLVTVAGNGLCDWLGQDRETCYEPGVKLYVDEQRNVAVLNAEPRRVRTTSELRGRWAHPWARLYSYLGNYQLPPQLPEAYTTDSHLILLGDSRSSVAVRALQASELLLQTVDEKYPGPGKALIQFAWSPFAVGRNVIFVGASNDTGLRAGVARLADLAR